MSSYPGSESYYLEAHRKERSLQQRRLMSAQLLSCNNKGAPRSHTEPLHIQRTAGEVLGLSSNAVYKDQYYRVVYSARLPTRYSSTEYMMQW
ncbi:hypothetical protein GBAR_LOCUS10437 [Geodia barretti]|uniref:Uncharacterized protein n=1 Tax=Geodia barretti TaxID=519541 RepID=A0AA35RTT6_GEOBA|nr:hypothetical protein GBAR_LOCUS10437 [Geodia barretti]